MPAQSKLFDITVGVCDHGLPCCHPKGYQIFNIDKFKNVEDLTPSDSIFCDGNIINIKNIHQRDYKGYIYHIYSNTNYPISVTEEHPIFSQKFFNCYTASNTICLPYFKCWESCESSNKKRFEFPKYVRADNLTTNDHLFNKISLDRPGLGFSNDYLWLAGLYLAEGCYDNTKSEVQYSINSKESNIKEKLKLLLENLNYNSPREYNYNRSASSIRLSGFKDFYNLFGGYSYTKTLPFEWMQNISKDELLCLWKGYEVGDGYHQTRTSIRYKAISSVSDVLLYQFYYLFSIFGFGCTIYKRKNYIKKKDQIHQTRDIYVLNVWDDCKKTRGMRYGNDETLVKIRKIEKEWYEGKVYGIETNTGYYDLPSRIHNCPHG